MTRTTPSGRSGDPRKRAAAAVEPSRSRAARRRLAVVGAVLVVTAGAGAVALARDDGAPVAGGRARAAVACDFTTKAAEAADRPTRARLAAAVLLLDQAVMASEHAARTDGRYRSLDEAVKAVHSAGHRGDSGGWNEALDRALDTCAGV